MSLPYFPLYPDDFEADTAHLTLAEDGAYNRLLRLCWRTPGCKIPADEVWIFRRMRAHTEADHEVIRTILDEFFSTAAGKMFSRKLLKIYEETNLAHQKRVAAGSKGGRAKALKINKTTSSNAVAKPKQPELEPEPIRETPKGVLSSQPPAIDEIAEAVAEYNLATARAGWPKVQTLSKPRRTALAARLKEAGGLDGWKAALEKAETSPFLTGQTSRPFFASFDFLTKQANFTKLMEGNYDPRQPTNPSGPDRPKNRPDPALEQIARLTGIGKAPRDDCAGAGGHSEENGSFRMGAGSRYGGA